ncbi:hypothetical protein P7C73_g6586, partial [Tremellales sp. Uapishka_1]
MSDPPSTYYVALVLFHLFPLHAPLTLYVLDAPFGRFSKATSGWNVNADHLGLHSGKLEYEPDTARPGPRRPLRCPLHPPRPHLSPGLVAAPLSAARHGPPRRGDLQHLVRPQAEPQLIKQQRVPHRQRPAVRSTSPLTCVPGILARDRRLGGRVRRQR